MATTMDNLEKLIQMATIEHMYSMLQKMKTDNSTNFKESIISDENNLTDASGNIAETLGLFRLLFNNWFNSESSTNEILPAESRLIIFVSSDLYVKPNSKYLGTKSGMSRFKLSCFIIELL